MQDGVQGIVVKPRDVEGLVGAMLTLGCNRQINESMGQEAVKVGQIRNTWQDYSTRLYEEMQLRCQEIAL